jgi:hypothetical protein
MDGMMMKKYAARGILSGTGIVFRLMEIMAQSPTHIDTRTREPQPFTPGGILMYIVFPVLLFIAVLWGRHYQKKKRESKETPGS